MAFTLFLSPALKAKWKVKIRDKERLEDSHVTIFCGHEAWRLGLRNGEFLDKGAKWSLIDKRVKLAIEDNWMELIAAWDERYSNNPVHGNNDE